MEIGAVGAIPKTALGNIFGFMELMLFDQSKSQQPVVSHSHKTVGKGII